MRITPVNMFRANAKKPQNVSFGKIEEANREKIIENLPVEASNEEDRKLYKQWDVGALDGNEGIMVKWGGEGHPRGLIYADLIKEHVERSNMKNSYLEMTKEYWGDNKDSAELYHCLNNIENPSTYKVLMASINAINMYEALGDEALKTKSNSSDIDKPDREERMWDLYGTRL